MNRYVKVRNFIFQVLKKKLSKKYVYHSLIHTKEVIHFVVKIGTLEKISNSDLFLLKTAALYHDVGYVFSYDEHEFYGAEFAKRTLPIFNYTQDEIAIISSLILATKFPQKPANKSQEILCDADLMNLGNDTFFRKNRLFRRELENFGVIFSDVEWAKKTKEIMHNQKYFTDSAKFFSKENMWHNKLMTKNIY